MKLNLIPQNPKHTFLIGSALNVLSMMIWGYFIPYNSIWLHAFLLLLILIPQLGGAYLMLTAWQMYEHRKEMELNEWNTVTPTDN